MSTSTSETTGTETVGCGRLLRVRRLGVMDYAAALRVQKETEIAVKTRTAPDTLLLVEHPHVITLGRRSTDSALRRAPERLAAMKVEVVETNRGGKATYHGFGQLVGYPIINLSPDREDVHLYVRDLERMLILVLADFGIDAFPVKGLTGVHTAEGKIAAIGIHIARWVTTHGFALNVNTDLAYFDLITPCEGEPVAAMRDLIGREVNLDAVADRVVRRFSEVFGIEVERTEDRSQGVGSDRTTTHTRDAKMTAS